MGWRRPAPWNRERGANGEMWIRLLSVAAGLCLLAAPAVVGYGGVWRTSDRIAGALVVSVAIMAMSGVMRPLRWINVALGGWGEWILLSPIVLERSSTATGHRVFAGLLILSTALVRGQVRTRQDGAARP
jgi:hypothetical protein